VSFALAPGHGFAIGLLSRQARRTYRLIRERIARINGYLQEAISGMSAIALAGREERAFAESRASTPTIATLPPLDRIEASLFSFQSRRSGTSRSRSSSGRGGA